MFLLMPRCSCVSVVPASLQNPCTIPPASPLSSCVLLPSLPGCPIFLLRLDIFSLLCVSFPPPICFFCLKQGKLAFSQLARSVSTSHTLFLSVLSALHLSICFSFQRLLHATLFSSTFSLSAFPPFPSNPFFLHTIDNGSEGEACTFHGKRVFAEGRSVQRLLAGVACWKGGHID